MGLCVVKTVSGIVKTTGQMLIRLGVTCLLLWVAALGLCADAKKAAEAKAEIESLQKEIERLRELMSFTPGSNAVAAQVKACPDGHKTLKDVPILYGTPSFEPKDRKASETAVARFEYWPGGCVSGSDFPTNRVTCTTCGFGLDAEYGAWSGYRQAPTQFSRPFSAPILSFPIPGTNSLISGPTYHQTIRKGGVQLEGLDYTSREQKGEIVKRVDDWFRKQGLNPSKYVQSNRVSGPTTELVKWEVEKLTVQLNHFGEEGTTAIYVSSQRESNP